MYFEFDTKVLLGLLRDILVGEAGRDGMILFLVALGLTVILEEVILLGVGLVQKLVELMVSFHYLDEKHRLSLYWRVALDYHLLNDEIVLAFSISLQNMRVICFIPVMGILPCFLIPQHLVLSNHCSRNVCLTKT